MHLPVLLRISWLPFEIMCIVAVLLLSLAFGSQRANPQEISGSSLTRTGEKLQTVQCTCLHGKFGFVGEIHVCSCMQEQVSTGAHQTALDTLLADSCQHVEEKGRRKKQSCLYPSEPQDHTYARFNPRKSLYYSPPRPRGPGACRSILMDQV